MEDNSKKTLDVIGKYSKDIGYVIDEHKKTGNERGLRDEDTENKNNINVQNVTKKASEEIGKKLGLDVDAISVMSECQGLINSFLGRAGEKWLSTIKEKSNLGMYTHNSEMIRRVIYREEIFKQILERIMELHPDITEYEIYKLKKKIWLIFDGIDMSNKREFQQKIETNTEKTETDFEAELCMIHKENSLREVNVPATPEGALVRQCNKIANTLSDILYGLDSGIIDILDEDYAKILIEIGITEEEISNANMTKNYKGIVKKVQTIFATSIIENSSKDSIQIDPEMNELLNELKNVNKREITDLEVLTEDEATYPSALETLIHHYAKLLTDNFYSIDDIKNIKTNTVLTNSFTRKFGGTPDEGFVRYILDMTPESYNFNKENLGKSKTEKKNENDLIKMDLDYKMALELGAEYVATLGDYEFLNLLFMQGIIDDEKRNSLTRTYKVIGKEGIIKERYKPEEGSRMLYSDLGLETSLGNTLTERIK